MMSFYPVAMMDVSKVEKASPDKLIEIALKNDYDLKKYVYKK